MLHDVKDRRNFFARRIKTLVRDFDGVELASEYLPFLEVLTASACLLEAGRLWELHPTIVMVGKRCPLVHNETKRRRKALWDAVSTIHKEITIHEQDAELKELKSVLVLTNKALCGFPERLTMGRDHFRVTVTAFFQEQMLLAIRGILTEAKVA